MINIFTEVRLDEAWSNTEKERKALEDNLSELQSTHNCCESVQTKLRIKIDALLEELSTAQKMYALFAFSWFWIIYFSRNYN